MSVVTRNILANFLGRGWSSIIFIIFTPIYIHLLGMEAYGLIGFFGTLQATLFLLDFGLSMSLTRELARLSVSSATSLMRDTLRTLEVMYWLLAISMLLLLFLIAPFIAGYWLNSSAFSTEELEYIVILMGVALAVQFPNNLYASGLYGLQKQVLANSLSMIFVTVRFAGAALILWLYSPSIELFFAWHLSIAFIQSVVTGTILWRSLPSAAGRPRFQWAIIKGLFSFAAGMGGIGLVNTLFSQADKVILSALLPLEYFGYYVLAATIAMGLFMFITPIYSALFPRLTQLIEDRNELNLQKTYHRGCQIIAVITIPVFCSIAFFSYDVMYIWTGEQLIANESFMLLSLLVLSVLFNGMMSMPMALQLAYGTVSLLLRLRLIMLVFLLALLMLVVPVYGTVGAAASLMLVELCYLCAGVYLMHQKFMVGRLRRWLFNDIIPPGIAAFLIVWAGWLFFPVEASDFYSKLGVVIAVFIICSIAIIMAAMSASLVRPWLNNKIKALISK